MNTKYIIYLKNRRYIRLNREDLINLFDKNKEDVSKHEKNRKRIREINNTIERIKKNTDTKTTTTFKENSTGRTNRISNTIEDCIERKEEKIKELEEEKAKLEAENIIIKSRIEDVEILLKALKFKEKTIIVEHYIEGNSYEDIGNRVYWNLFKQTRGGEAIKKIADRAIEKMLKI